MKDKSYPYGGKMILKRIFLLSICSLLFVAGCSQPQQDTLDPAEKQASELLNKAEVSAIRLQEAIEQIEKIKRYNTPERIAAAIEIISLAESDLVEADKDIENYIAFVEKYGRELNRKEVGHYVRVKDLFNSALLSKRNALKEYLESFKAWLEYTNKNFDAIRDGKTTGTVYYERLLYNYHKSYDEYYSAQDRFLKHVKQYLTDHPELIAKFGKEYKLAKKELDWE